MKSTSTNNVSAFRSLTFFNQFQQSVISQNLQRFYSQIERREKYCNEKEQRMNFFIDEEGFGCKQDNKLGVGRNIYENNLINPSVSMFEQKLVEMERQEMEEEKFEKFEKVDQKKIEGEEKEKKGKRRKISERHIKNKSKENQEKMQMKDQAKDEKSNTISSSFNSTEMSKIESNQYLKSQTLQLKYIYRKQRLNRIISRVSNIQIELQNIFQYFRTNIAIQKGQQIQIKKDFQKEKLIKDGIRVRNFFEQQQIN